jgi:hypothetical protein
MGSAGDLIVTCEHRGKKYRLANSEDNHEEGCRVALDGPKKREREIRGRGSPFPHLVLFVPRCWKWQTVAICNRETNPVVRVRLPARHQIFPGRNLL